MNADRFFIDSNILVYAYDAGEPRKQAIAQTVLRQAVQSSQGCVSPQVFGEFFQVTVVRKRLLEPIQAERILRSLAVLEAPVLGLDRVWDALRIRSLCQLGYWDSLIVASAKAAKCRRLLSEDFSHGHHFDGVVAENPFAEPHAGAAGAARR